MTLSERIMADLKAAMIGKDTLATSTLRLLKGELKNAEIASGAELEESKQMEIIRQEIKKRSKSVEMYRQGGNPEQADTEQKEADFLSQYLPAQASEADVKAFIQERIAALGADAQKGPLIRETMAQFAGLTDGKTVSGLIDQLLG
jgi:uncharacterized protein YqeY